MARRFPKIGHIVVTATTVALAAGCGGGGDDSGDTATGDPVPELISIEQVVNNDWMGVEAARLLSTNVAPELETLRELSTPLYFIVDSLSPWGLEVVDRGQVPVTTQCIRVTEVTSHEEQGKVVSGTWSIALDNCNISGWQGTPVSGEGEVSIDQGSMELRLDSYSTNTDRALLKGTTDIFWADLNKTTEPETLSFSLEAEYTLGELQGRVFHVDEGLALLPENIEGIADYLIPDAALSADGARISANGDDVLSFGATVINGDGLYSGGFRGSLIGSGGGSVPFGSGFITEEAESVAVSTTGSGSDGGNLDIYALSATWDASSSTVTGEVGFGFTGETMVFLDRWSASVGFQGFSRNNVAFTGGLDGLHIADAGVEFAYSYSDNLGGEQAHWQNGMVENLTFTPGNLSPSAGVASALSTDGSDLQLYFQSATASTGWVLFNDSSGEWGCLNLDSGERSFLDSEPAEHEGACS